MGKGSGSEKAWTSRTEICGAQFVSSRKIPVFLKSLGDYSIESPL